MLSDLNELFGALAVGVFTLVTVSLSLWSLSFTADSYTSWVAKRLGRVTETTAAIIVPLLLLMLLGLSLLVQDVTDYLVDSEKRVYIESRFWPPQLIRQILRDEPSHRFDTVFREADYPGELKQEEKKKCIAMRGLGVELFKNRPVLDSVVAQTRTVDQPADPAFQATADFLHAVASLSDRRVISFDKMGANVLNDEGRPIAIDIPENELRRVSYERTKALTNLMYYRSKNWAYQNNNYYDELAKLQRRIDFSRSNALVSGWLLTLYVPILSFCFLASFARDTRLFPANFPAKSDLRKAVQRLLWCAAFLLGCFICFREGYTRSENNFNERVFGYYSSHHHEKRMPIAIPESDIKSSVSCATLNGVLWMQTSAEYRMTCAQTFKQAGRLLGQALSDPEWSAVEMQQDTAPDKVAVILDLDETVLDNSAFQASLIANGEQFSEALFKEWVELGRASAIDGALPFVRACRQAAEDAGVELTVFYVSNRDQSLEEATRRNLKNLGFPLSDIVDDVLCQNEKPDWTSDKETRRRSVASDHRVLFLIGDDAGDFTSVNGLSAKSRVERLEQYKSHWGTKWIILPNPVYGSWERAVGKRKLDALTPF